jgi:flagellar hook protein FlgE
MSINSSLLSGVSGLIANSSALAAISDNIANVNTTAYKRNQVNFANVVTAQAVKGRYSAGGVQGIVRSYIADQGLIQQSTRSTDMAISGNGFFVVAEKGADLTNADPRSFTRQGTFAADSAGYLRNDSGYYLQGWPVQSDGTFATSPSDLTTMQSINVRDLGGTVSPTTTMGITANLDSRSTSPAPDPINVKVVDSLGGERTLRMTFTKAAAPAVNQWNMAVATVPASNATLAPAGPVAVTFNTDGTINQVNGAAPDAFNLGFTWDATLGLANQSIAIDLSKLTQNSDVSTLDTVRQNGAGVGTFVSAEVGEDGIVSAFYSNGQTRQIAKVAIATFPNPDGLAAVSGNAYRPTRDAGEFVLKQAGVGGAGLIAPSSLEASKVDLSSEFTGLIQTQRAYSACSKIITTADQMLDELINIKR